MKTGFARQRCRHLGDSLLPIVFASVALGVVGGCAIGGQGAFRSRPAEMSADGAGPAGPPAQASAPVVSFRVPSDERWIVHSRVCMLRVLNRLGYGPRPGDVERVRQMGLANYLALQLTPERIPDPLVEAKLQPLPSLSMHIRELYQATRNRNHRRRGPSRAAPTPPNPSATTGPPS